MKVWVLGPLEVSGGGQSVQVHGPLPRRLLALLSLTPGQEVGRDRLIDGLWGDAAPAAAPTTLHSHVARLRRELPGDVVRTGRSGYRLDVGPDDVDAQVFERSVGEGSTALAAGRIDAARTLLAQALQLWRAGPYPEFADCPVLAAEAQRLEVLRLDALEQRISCDLARPGAATPVAELEALVRWHPLRESFWGLLMAAQFRAGRQADALGSYQRLRRILADELGAEPGPHLQELKCRILAADLSLQRPGGFTIPPPHPPSASYPDPVELVERDHLTAALDAVQADTLAGAGRLVFVHGEAGSGKSALVRNWVAGASDRSRVLWGACDPLSSPRALGPLVDVAGDLGPAVVDMLRSGERDGLFEVTLQALLQTGPVVLVVEDLHWADMSTLDLMRFLARRLDGTSTMVVATYRDDHLQPDDPLRVMLGDVASQPVVRRIEVPLLSADAVARLATGSDLDPVELHRETGGNAFFVTEVLASGGEALPRTVQDAVLARVQRLSPQARLALEGAAVIGSRVEPSLLLAMPEVAPEAVDECVTSGMLRFHAPAYVFRHELVRQAVLSGVMPGRLGALHWQALDRLRAMPMSPPPLARLAEHAEMAGDGPATLEFATAAGDLARKLGSHREAAFQYGRAMAHIDLCSDEKVALLGKRAQECQVADEHEHAIDAWNRQLDLLRGQPDRADEVVDALFGLDESYYTIGDNSHGTEFIDEAYALLEGGEPSGTMARVLAMRGIHHLRASENEASLPWLESALAMAHECGSRYVISRAGGALGMARFLLGEHEAGLAQVREALEVALAADEEDLAARYYQNIAALAWLRFDLEEALAEFEDAERYTAEHDLNGHLMCVLASEISLKLDLGRWDEALADADDLLYVRNTGRASRIDPLMAIGLVAARRGDHDRAWEHLDAAREYIARSQTLGYQGFVATARGEAHLLADDVAAVAAEALPWYEEAVRLADDEVLPDLALLVWRAGLIDRPPDGLRAPEVWSMNREYRRAAEFWAAAGAPYKAAWALLDSDVEVDLREARARFEQLDAPVLVRRTDDKLRAIGAKVPRGARPSTRANVGGLTDREVEVLALLEEGLRNSEIAARLYLSEKTVGHHVSAILGKLGVASRLEAVARARQLSPTAS